MIQEGTTVIEVNAEGTGYETRSPIEAVVPPGWECQVGAKLARDPATGRLVPGFYQGHYRVVPRAGLLAWARRHWWGLNVTGLVLLALWAVALGLWGWWLLDRP